MSLTFYNPNSLEDPISNSLVILPRLSPYNKWGLKELINLRKIKKECNKTDKCGPINIILYFKDILNWLPLKIKHKTAVHEVLQDDVTGPYYSWRSNTKHTNVLNTLTLCNIYF